MEDQEKKEIENAFRKISGKLSLLPDEFRYWKKINQNGEVEKNKIYFYKKYFDFIKNERMKTNLSELRLCLDYHCSLFKLHKPILTFEWHHRLVIFQILGSIYEGILYDFIEFKIDSNKKEILNVIAKEKINNKNIGLGNLKEILFNSEIIGKENYDYIEKIRLLRNTIHPKSLKDEKTLFSKNPLIKKEVDVLLEELDIFIKFIKNKY